MSRLRHWPHPLRRQQRPKLSTKLEWRYESAYEATPRLNARKQKRPAGLSPYRPVIQTLAVSLEAQGTRELQLTHVAAGCNAGDLSNVGVLYIVLRCTQVGMVEDVARIGPQRKRKA